MPTGSRCARAQPGVGPDDLARVQRDAYADVDRYCNSGQTMPSGNRLHVNVEFTDDPALAHLGVHDDDSLMGNYWTADANGKPVPTAGTHVKPRHTQQSATTSTTPRRSATRSRAATRHPTPGPGTRPRPRSG